MKSKIQLTDSIQDVFFKLSVGNPGALRVCVDILKEGEAIDPDGAMGGLGVLLLLDTFGIYGSKIWILYKDVCNCELSAMLAVLRACQLGFVTEDEILRAIDNRGAGLNVADLHAKVRKAAEICCAEIRGYPRRHLTAHPQPSKPCPSK